MNNNENVIELPEDGQINVEWARKSLEKAVMFSSFDLNMNKARVFFMLKTHLDDTDYNDALKELEYTTETVDVYLQFLDKASVLESIRDKYSIPISLSASELVPNNLEDALALCDIALAKYHKITAETLKKALESTGQTVTKLSNSAITIEKMKRKALNEWLLNEHGLSEDDIHQASTINTLGRNEFLEQSLQAYALLGEWKRFYDIIAKPVHDSEDMVALRFLADMQNASSSIEEYLASELANRNLNTLKEIFNNEVYPKLQFEANKGK